MTGLAWRALWWIQIDQISTFFRCLFQGSVPKLDFCRKKITGDGPGGTRASLSADSPSKMTLQAQECPCSLPCNGPLGLQKGLKMNPWGRGLPPCLGPIGLYVGPIGPYMGFMWALLCVPFVGMRLWELSAVKLAQSGLRL